MTSTSAGPERDEMKMRTDADRCSQRVVRVVARQLYYALWGISVSVALVVLFSQFKHVLTFITVVDDFLFPVSYDNWFHGYEVTLGLSTRSRWVSQLVVFTIRTALYGVLMGNALFFIRQIELWYVEKHREFDTVSASDRELIGDQQAKFEGENLSDVDNDRI